jgi:hypothetical protein
MAFRYFTKLDDDDKPITLFRVDPEANLEQAWTTREGWIPTPGFLENIIDGSFQYSGITEPAARENFPGAFDD